MNRSTFLKVLIAGLPGLFAFNPARQKKSARLAVVWLAGYAYYRAPALINVIPAGASIELRREPSNPYDNRAIEVFFNEQKLGYIPRADNEWPAALMDAGVRLHAKVMWTSPDDPDNWQKLRMEVIMEIQTG